MLSYFRYSINTKSCISCRILIYSGSKSEIQHLSLKRSLSFVLKEYFNMETLILIFIKKIYYFSHIIMINLAKASLYFLTLFHYFFINSSINEFSLIISLFFFWNSNFVVSLFFF